MARLVVVQYAGDYLEAYRLLQASGKETYYGHSYVLDQVTKIGDRFGEAAVLCCNSSQKYRVKLPSGLTVVGAQADPAWRTSTITKLLNDLDPTHLAVFGALTGIIRWGVATRRRVIGLFADSFEINPVRRFYRYGRLASLVNNSGVDWIANHGINSCLSLARIGVDRQKIIPMDWPHVRRPDDTPVKKEPSTGVVTLVFVGAVTRRKGVGDLISAVAELKRRRCPVRLKVVGAGDVGRFKALAEQSNVGAEVDFIGLVPNDAVFQIMKDASIVVVPSQHEYPEGFPLTIYEALCSRTPIVASDHPMFSGRLVHGTSAMIYIAGKPRELADAIEELLSKPGLYRSLSAAAQDTWESLQLPVKWGELLYRWVADGDEDRRWLFDHRLDSGLYGRQLGRPSDE